MTANQASLARTGLPAPQATGAVSICPILGKGDIVTGVRGTTDGNVGVSVDTSFAALVSGPW